MAFPALVVRSSSARAPSIRLPGQIGNIIPSGYLDALRNISGFDAPTWTVGLDFAYPLGKSAQEANVARSKLSLDQSTGNLKSLELQIATEVTNDALTGAKLARERPGQRRRP